MHTRALIVEFTVYNANVNLFCIVTLLFETTAVGKADFYIIIQFTAMVKMICIMFPSHQLIKTVLIDFIGAFQFHTELHSVRLYQSTGGFHIFVMAIEIIYLLFILHYMFLQVSINTITEEYVPRGITD